MAATGALSDVEVRKQIEQMVSFIHQEAKEKAKEIQVKGEEEFSLEKSSIFQSEKTKIAKEYEAKEKKFVVEKRIAYSTQLAQNRLKVLRERDAILHQIEEDTLAALSKLSSQPTYAGLIEKLIVQGCILLDEGKVSVRARSADHAVVEKTFSAAAASYKKITGKTVQLSLDYVALPATSAGGVVLACQDGKILCNNSLEARLEMVVSQAMPVVRSVLFAD